MMIGIASELKMVDGAFILDVLPDSKTREGSRRVVSRKTLDGGVVIIDGGFAHGDRNVMVSIESSEELWAKLWPFFQTVLSVTVSLEDGCFLGALDSVSENSGVIVMRVLLKEKISE